MDYSDIIPLDKQDTRRLARAWLFLGIGALLLSGVFALLLVISRTPAIQNHIPFIDFFHTALVVHVDLSVLIWFTAFASILWTMSCRQVNPFDWLALALSISGTLLIVVTPFIVDGHPLMNNYIPVLQTPVFYLGLSLYTGGLLIRIIHTLAFPLPINLQTAAGALAAGVWLSALAALAAIIAFIYTFIHMPGSLDPIAYFEILFWGSGHILQFTHMLLVFVVWIILLQQFKTGLQLFSPPVLATGLVLTFLPVLYSSLIYWRFEVTSGEHLQQFTLLMQYGSLTSLPLGLIILNNLIRREHGVTPDSLLPLKRTVWCSGALFATGGILGFMIEGVNVVIPAHYHGSIVGITLAFMGFSYYLLPRFGFTLRGKALKLARIQPVIYALGQFMHITGLAWSGGYGVQRKTAGAAQGLDRLPEIAGMALMGTGGLIAIIGGILFVVICFLAIWHRNRTE